MEILLCLSPMSHPTVGTDSDAGNVEYLHSVNYTKPFLFLKHILAAIEMHLTYQTDNKRNSGRWNQV